MAENTMTLETAKAWVEQFIARVDPPVWTALCFVVLGLAWLAQAATSARRHAAFTRELAALRGLDRRISALEYVVNRGMAGLVRQQSSKPSPVGLDASPDVGSPSGDTPEQRPR